MSGEGMIASAMHSAIVVRGDQERGDVLAFLRRRHANAARVSGRPGMDALADDRRRQLEVLIEAIEQGLHEGEAEVAEVREGLTRPVAELGAEAADRPICAETEGDLA